MSISTKYELYATWMRKYESALKAMGRAAFIRQAGEDCYLEIIAYMTKHKECYATGIPD